MRVRDLEIALVLAREMKAAAARSVDASLRLDQLQEVFGVEELDRTERARIQTALQMAGLEPFPSLLEADPAEPIRFGAAKVAAPAGAGASASAEPPAHEPPAEAPPTFPTVGQFARSKFGRSRRARRGDNDHGAGHAPPPLPELPPEDELEAEDVEVPEKVAEPEVTQVHEQVPDAVAAEPVEAHEPEAETAVQPELEAEAELEAEPVEAQEPEPDSEDEREYIPLVPPEEVEPPVTGYGAHAAPAEPEPVAAQPPARSDELVVALLPAVAIPVIITSIAGWRFGLPFVALSVIATGVLRGRRSGAATVLATTAVVTVLSVVASVVLASVGKDSSSSNTEKAATPAKPTGAAKPASTAAKPATKPTKPSKPKSSKKKQKSETPGSAQNEPAPDPGTEGLVRVPPQSNTPAPLQATGPNGTGTTTRPGTSVPQQPTP